MKALIAEDDRVLSRLLASELTRSGIEVIVAFDAMQSLMLAMKSSPSVIILDIQMPGGTGLDVLRKLKTSNKTNLIPVLVLSGSVDQQVGEIAKRLGAEEFLTKPPDFQKLHDVLNRVLAKTQSASIPAMQSGEQQTSRVKGNTG